MKRQKDRWTDDVQEDRLTDGQKDRWAEGWMDIWAEGWMDIWTEGGGQQNTARCSRHIANSVIDS